MTSNDHHRSLPAGALPRATRLAHIWVADCLPAGGIAVDATSGNGHDTEFLSGACGPDGIVHAFDIQSRAITQTRARLDAAGISNVSLHQRCHSRIADELGGQLAGRIHAVMFNLGYLPGGDRSRITRRETTLAALECALTLLAPGGIVTIVGYTGHPGGAEETAAVEDHARMLGEAEWQVAQFRHLNQRNRPPELIGIVKRGGADLTRPVPPD